VVPIGQLHGAKLSSFQYQAYVGAWWYQLDSCVEGKVRENPKFYRHILQNDVPAIIQTRNPTQNTFGARRAWTKNNLAFTETVHQARNNENVKCQNVTVTLFVLKVAQSARRVFQRGSSLKLPYLSSLLWDRIHFIGFPVGGLTPPGQLMCGRKPCMGESPAALRLLRAKLSSFQHQSYVEAHSERWPCGANEKGKMRENPKFYRNTLQTNVLGKFSNFSWCKNTFTQGGHEAKTFQQSQNLFVKCVIMKTISAKTSLLHFLYWKLCSLRAGFVKHIHPSHSLMS